MNLPRIVALAAHHSIPAISEWRAFVENGRLMSYGSDLVEAYRQVGTYARAADARAMAGALACGARSLAL
jgi:hypothetical protein